MGSSLSTLDFVPVGFRFRPTDEELVNHYLKHKLLGHDSIVEKVIPEIDVCKVEPWDLPAMISALSVIKSDGPEWCFFSPRDYKYAKSKRFNRTTKRGFWKTTGTDRKIKIKGTNKIIGTKRTLVFYEGRVPGGVKRNWVIHEYHAVTFDECQRSFVLCRLMRKVEKKAEGETYALIYDEREPSRHMGSDYENQATLEVQEINDILPEMNPSSTQQSPVGFEQGVSFPNPPNANAYFGNEIHNVQTPFETTEEEDDFINLMLINEDVDINKNIEHAFGNSPTEFRSRHWEEEPSRHMSSDYENQAILKVQDINDILLEMNWESIFQEACQADTYFPSSTQQSPVGFEQEVSFPNPPNANAYFGNEIHNVQTPFETTEDSI